MKRVSEYPTNNNLSLLTNGWADDIKVRCRKSSLILTTLLITLMVLSGQVVYADEGDITYSVTIKNLTDGQPFSPPVAATHRGGIRMFKLGKPASDELEAIAEDGYQIPMFALFDASEKVTEAVDVGKPLTPSDTMVGDFSDSATFEIMSRKGDKFSLATMLICTNDGFTGLNRVKLPSKGSRIFFLNGYDAGTEDNTEMSEDIVDPCSALGPVGLAGDPNGNENDAVDTDPKQRIHLHPNIMGDGDLTVDVHGWEDPVAKVTITRVADDAVKFEAFPSGTGEVPPVDTDAEGKAKFELVNGGAELKFDLKVFDIEDVTQAHIHDGLPNQNGPVVAFLFGPADPSGPVDGRLARGTLSESDLLGAFAGDFAGFVDALRKGELYVNVHTLANPPGEIRGQIGAR